MQKPSIKQLQYLVKIAQLGSVRKAADAMKVSQPTVTAQVTNLESRFETQLLERTTKGTQLTATGRLLLPHIQKLISQYEDVCRLVLDIKHTPAGTYNIGVPDTFGPYLLPEIIPELRRIYPNLRFFVREDVPVKLESDLFHGNYDFILSPLPFDNTRLQTELLFYEPILLIAPPDHPLAEQTAISRTALQEDKLLVIDEHHRFYTEIVNLANELGMEVLRDYSGTSLNTLRLMIAAGMGLSFIPALYVDSEIRGRNDLVALNLGFELPKRKIAMAWRQKSPQKHFYQSICKVIQSIVAKKFNHAIEPAN